MKLEETLASVKLASLGNDDLGRTTMMGAIWDTLGWALFRSGDNVKAEKYVEAAWNLTQQGAEADHLGQIYEKQGRKEDARHAYELALAAGGVEEETTERLNRLGGPVDAAPRPTFRREGNQTVKLVVPNRIAPAEELGKLRTTDVPLLARQTGTAEFFVSFSKAGMEETRFIKGDQSLKDADTALAKAPFKIRFPDDGPEKIVRRGILSCSALTKPNCQFVMLLPSTTSTN